MSRRSLLHSTLLSVAIAAFGAANTWAEAPKFENEQQEILYVLGVAMSDTVADFNFSEEEIQHVSRGLVDGALNRATDIVMREYGERLQALRDERVTAAVAVESKASAEFLEEAAKGDGVVRTESGLLITEVRTGNGESPGPEDTVKVHYHGTFRDGTVFDSSVERGQPAEFPLNRVIPCWTEGLGLMKVGGKSRLVCSPTLAYGDRGIPPRVPGGAVLTFEVELLEIVD